MACEMRWKDRYICEEEDKRDLKEGGGERELERERERERYHHGSETVRERIL